MAVLLQHVIKADEKLLHTNQTENQKRLPVEDVAMLQ